MDYSEFNTADSVRSFLQALKTTGITRLDTALRYPPTNPGRSEELLGEADTAAAGQFSIDTKVMTQMQCGKGTLSEEKILDNVENSLTMRKAASVNVLYIHRSDPTTPLEE